jgi:hypothetical protein
MQSFDHTVTAVKAATAKPALHAIGPFAVPITQGNTKPIAKARDPSHALVEKASHPSPIKTVML